MNVIPAIFLPGIIGVIIFSVAFFKYPKWAIAGLIIAKPIIDLTWEYHILLNINFLKLYAGLFVILGTIYIIYKRINVLQHPISLIWFIFLGLNFISIFIISDAYFLIDKMKYFLSISTGFVALILFANLFDYKKDQKRVLSIFIIAGIFPSLLWLIPVLLGNPILSNDEVGRIIGPYHSFSNFKFYAMQTIICCLAYLALSSRHCLPLLCDRITRLLNNLVTKHSKALRLVKRVVLYLMILISVAMVYKCYTKAGWVILVIWFLLWLLLMKKYILLFIVPIVVGLLIFVNPYAKVSRDLFLKKTNPMLDNQVGEGDIFRGRIGTWKNMLISFQSVSFVHKYFGAKRPFERLDNDYLRVLWDNGIAGFVIYLILLCQTGYLIIRQYIKNKVPIVLLAALVWLMFILESIGLYALFSPSLQWFTWGMIGFSLSSGYANAL